MGTEYKIAFPRAAADTVDGILRSATYFAQAIQIDHQLIYEYRLPSNSGKMPNGHASIESYGIYFCDFGGARDTMADVVKQITDRIGTPDVAEFEWWRETAEQSVGRGAADRVRLEINVGWPRPGQRHRSVPKPKSWLTHQR